MITLSSLKASKYYPGTEGAKPPLNCSWVHRPWATSSNPVWGVPVLRNPLPPPRLALQDPFLLDCDVRRTCILQFSHL